MTNAALVFLTSLFLARVLGPGGYGIYAYSIAWVAALAPLSLLGLDLLITREVSRYAALEKWGLQRGVISWGQQVVVGVSLLIAVAFALGAWLLVATGNGLVRQSLWISSLILPLWALTSLKQGAIWGLGHVIDAQLPLMVVVPGLLLLFAGLGSLLIPLSAPMVLWMRLAVVAVAFAYASLRVRRYLPSPALEAAEIRDSIAWRKSTIPLLMVAAAPILNDQIAVVVLGSMSGPESAGLYDAARRGAMLVALGLTAVNVPLAPAFARFNARSESAELQRVVTNGARFALMLSLPAALFLVALRGPLLGLFGPGFEGAAPALIILCLGQVVNAGMGSVGTLLNMTGHERDAAIVSIGATILNLLLTLTFVPLLGIEGAAIASASTLFLWNLLLARVSYQRLGVYTPAFRVYSGLKNAG